MSSKEETMQINNPCLQRTGQNNNIFVEKETLGCEKETWTKKSKKSWKNVLLFLIFCIRHQFCYRFARIFSPTEKNLFNSCNS